MNTKQDEANLILKLYELRRDEALRKARIWFAIEFNPQSAQDIINLMRSGHPHGCTRFIRDKTHIFCKGEV